LTSSEDGSSRWPHGWHLDAMGTSSARASQTLPALSNWLTFPGWTRKVPLAFVVAVVVWAPQIAILTLRELLPHLLLLLGPIVHHITKARNSLRPILPKISIDAWVGDAVVEAVDDVVLQDVRDGGANVEEETRVGLQELVTFLFTLSKIVTSTCASNRSLEVVDEDPLEPVLGVDGVVVKALQPCERRRVQSHRVVDDFGDVRAPCDLNSRGVAMEPLLRSLLGVNLVMPIGLKPSGYL
jgi:hypothetical protein